MKKILIIQTAFLGDVILATPLIEVAHLQWPESKIDFLLREGNESLLEGHPLLRKVIIRNKAEGKWKSLLKVLREVRREGYDLVIDVHRFLSSGLIAGFSKGKHICGFDKNPLSWCFHHKVPHVISKDGQGVHEVERNLSLIHHLTNGKTTVSMRLYPSEEDYKSIEIAEPYVCLAPTSVWFSKQWPEKKWVGLIETLDKDLRVCLLGAPSDREVCEAIAQRANHPRIEVKAGELSLLQSAALMKGALMNYVNDSAPMHLASAMDASVTAVFLSTVPRFGFGPRSSQSHIVETPENLECRPCGLHGFRECPYGHFRCAEIPLELFPKPKTNHPPKQNGG